jgi:hypothetical protein
VKPLIQVIVDTDPTFKVNNVYTRSPIPEVNHQWAIAE